jgi:hypothetical protein
MKCTDCKYCIEEDYGYSNYTVEGTSADCLLGLNASMPVDRGWGTEPALDFAAQCQRFTKGDSVQVDCDREAGALENYSEDEEVRALLKASDA